MSVDADAVYAVEDSYGTLPGVPTWKQPGLDIEVGNASLERALIRARQPDSPTPAGSRAGNREGAFTISFSQDTGQDIHELIFPESTNTSLATSASLAPTATWYLRSGVPGGTDEERFLSGAAVESVTWNYTQGEKNSVDLTIIYGDEPEVGGSHGSAPGSFSQPAKSDIIMFSETDLDIDSVNVTKLQSFSLTISGMAYFGRGQQQTPIDARVGAYQPTMTVQATLEDSTIREYAYGATNAVAPQDTVNERDATYKLTGASNLSVLGTQPNTYSWSQLVSETDTEEPTDFHVSDVAVV